MSAVSQKRVTLTRQVSGAGVERVLLVPLGHGEVEVRTLVGEHVRERLERLGALLRHHVEEQRHAVATPRVGHDGLLLVDGEVAGGAQRRQQRGHVHRLDQLVARPLQTQPLARHQRHRHGHDASYHRRRLDTNCSAR